MSIYSISISASSTGACILYLTTVTSKRSSGYAHIIEALKRTPVDILGIAESKLDNSFPNAQFHIDGYRLFRRDRDEHGGGIMVYIIRSDIPCRRLPEFEIASVKLLTIEVLPQSNNKWLFINGYTLPKITRGTFTDEMTELLDKVHTRFTWRYEF